MRQSSDPTIPSPAAATALYVRAGRRRIALPFEVMQAKADIPAFVRVPGAAPWLLGLTQWRGGLLSLVDAGVLFGDGPCEPTCCVVLKGLEVDVALAVDEVLRLTDGAQPADLVLDQATLARHPAFQPGAATAPRRAREDS